MTRRRVRLSPDDAFRAQAQRVEARERVFMAVAAVLFLAAVGTYLAVLVGRA